jgi:hypothetical protein
MAQEIIGKIRNFLYYLECRLFPIDMEKIYRDQAKRSVVYGDRRITSFYLPHGIRQLDSEYSQRIMNMHESKEDPKNLRNDIKTNPHLHRKIKRNLLFNLRTYELQK